MATTRVALYNVRVVGMSSAVQAYFVAATMVIAVPPA